MKTLTTILAAFLLTGCLATTPEQMLDNALAECERVGMKDNEQCVFLLYSQQQQAQRDSLQRFSNAYKRWHHRQQHQTG